jgi:two-component system sensor histidine kinase YesM
MGEETPEGWKSIGIKNVYDRLKMNFGEEYGLDVKSRENVGTIVKLIMPVMNGVDDKDDKAAAGG